MDLSYAWNEGNHPFLIEVDGNIAGFCLIDRYRLMPGVDWNMSEFYVSGPWAGRGVGAGLPKPPSIASWAAGRWCSSLRTGPPCSSGGG